MEYSIAGAALAISVLALLHSFWVGQGQAKIQAAERHNRLRLDVHEQSLELRSLLREALRKAGSPEAVDVVEKLEHAADGLVSVYKDLGKNSFIPWGARTYSITAFDRLVAEMKEFSRILAKGREALESEDWAELSRVADGLEARVWGSKTNST